MIERIILMCAGKAERWGMHRGVHKHLVPVEGEMILDRTLRLVRKHSAAPIVIVAFDPAYSREGYERFEPRHGPVNFCDTDKFLSSEEIWGTSGQTIMVYGDVFFTEAAVRRIVSYQGPHRFFGRREWSYFTGCPWRELFALSFPAEERPMMLKEMLDLRSQLLAGKLKRGGGWELYEQMHGWSGENFTTIDDFTDDFDFPEDFERWLKRYRNPVHRTLAPLYAPAMKSWYWRLERWRKRLGKLRGANGAEGAKRVEVAAETSRGE